MAAAPVRKPQPKQAKLVKVLRIGILQDGKIVQEKRIGVGSTVTIGGSQKASFTYSLPNVPRKFPLFVAKGDRYFLRFLPSMAGKIAYKDGVYGLDELGKRGDAKRRGDVWILPLGEKNRGKISIGNVTVLFQFVPAPPEPLRPTYRTDFRPKLTAEDDSVFLGFLGLFTLLGAVFVIYVQSVETPALLATDTIPERFVKLTLPPQDTPDQNDEVPEELEGEGEKVEKDEDEGEASESSSEQSEKAEVKPETAAEREAREIAERQAAEQEVLQNSVLLQMIGTRGEGGRGSTMDVFDGNDKEGGDIDALMSGASGAEVATADNIGLKKGEGVGTGTGDVDIGDLASATGGKSGTTKGPDTKVSGRVAAGEFEVDGTEKESVGSRIRNYQGQVKACYEQRLKSNPSLAGRVEVEWYINGGRATGVSLMGNSTGDSALANCIVAKVKSWRFPGVPDDSVVIYPFILSPG